MQTHTTWMALTVASITLGLSVGCKQAPPEVAEVPPPPPSYEPTPLPPVALEEGGGNWQSGGAAGPGTQVEPVPVEPAPPAGQQTYTVRKGDTLWAIATRVYGNGQKWVDIAQANPSIDPAKLAVGQQLILP